MVDLLDEDEVQVIRSRLAVSQMAGKDFGEARPLNAGSFSSAVARQRAGFGDHLKYDTVHEVGATLFYGLVLNHAFENGNKRTALVALLAFLERNKFVLVDTSEDDLYDLALAVASHEMPVAGTRTSDAEVASVASWIRSRTRPRIIGDRHMPYRDFRRQLEELGCVWEKPSNNFIKVTRTTPSESLTVRLGYPGANFTVGVGDVKRVRRALKLDESHGVDSASFYDLEEMVDGFVNQYRQVLDRLAET